MDFLALKKQVIAHIRAEFSTQIEELKIEIENLKNSRDKETKSSAGDKHETSRAKIQTEIDRIETQAIQLKKELLFFDSISNVQEKNTSAKIGSLVVTSLANYFIGAGKGKIKLADKIVYSISPNAPIANLLNGKKMGDSVNFNSKQILIEAIF